MTDLENFIVIALSTAIGWSVALFVQHRAAALHLVSIPNQRSSHEQPTPHGGGVGIVLAGTFAITWLAWNHTTDWMIPSGLALLLGAVGLADDVRHLPARIRFGVQITVVAGFLWWMGDWNVAGWAMASLLLLAGVWWINLFNFMDGIDGIAALQAIFMLLVCALLSYGLKPDVIHNAGWWWMLSLAAATCGFLILNWPPARIFMGDVGSTYLAFLIFSLGWVLVRVDALTVPVWLILAAVFFSDASVTLMRRMMRGEQWYQAHRSHAYQRLARRWGAHRPVLIMTLAINLVWLMPLATAAQFWPRWGWGMAILAYLPLLFGAWFAGAGKADSE